nr:unnamed protein product [Callosobruchus analis]
MIAYAFIRRRRRRRRMYWLHPYIEKNINCRFYVAARELSEDDSVFRSVYRMTKDTYTDLILIVGPLIQKQNTAMRESVSPEERLLITLR